MRKRQKKVKKMVVEPVKSSALCILCGHLNSWEGEGKTRGSLLSSLKSWGNEEERSRDLLEEFGRQLQFGGTHQNQDGVGDGEGVIIDLMEVLWDKEGSKSYSWTLCWDCVPVVKRAVAEQRRCLKVEERVAKLQQRILEELRKLKEGMGKFYLELKGVDELMNGEGRKGDFGVVEGGPSTADSLRRRILGAINELQAYQEDLNVKLVEVTPSAEVKTESTEPLLKEEEVFDGPDPFPDMDCASPAELNDSDEDGLETDIGNKNNPPPAGDSGAEGGTDREKHDSDPESRSSSSPDIERDSSDSESVDSDNSGSESDSPSPPKRAKSSYKEIRHPKSISGTSTLKGMFILKAVLDQKARKHQLKTPTRKKEKDDLHDVIIDTEYSETTGKLTVGEVELIFDEELKLVQCGSCSFQVSWSEAVSTSNRKRKFTGKVHVSGKMMRIISDHIHAAHLDAFKCPTCGVRKNTRQYFFKHVRSFHRGICPCDICGRPFSNSGGRAKHKWTHMNEMEQEEEERRSGRRNPRTQLRGDKEKEVEPLFNCATCPKRYKTRRLLVIHERCHVKEVVICPVCGKSMRKTSYSLHKKYCPGGTGVEQFVPLKCIHCPSILKTREGFRIHMARSHRAPGDERPHLCFVCGMSFKSAKEVTRHMETHDEERRYKCRRGCGMDFNVRLNWRRHEAKCEFSAGDDADATDQN